MEQTRTVVAKKNPVPLRRKRTGILAVLAWLPIADSIGCVYDRAQWQKPDLVIERLQLSSGAIAADLGAGDGYFTGRLATATGGSGKVYAVEVSESLVRKLRENLENHANVQTVLASESDPKLPEPVDLIFVCMTYHHLGDTVSYFRNVRRYLRPGGRIAIIELEGTPWYLLLAGHQTKAHTIRAEMEQAGYSVVAQHADLKYQNFQVFRAGEYAPAVGASEAKQR